MGASMASIPAAVMKPATSDADLQRANLSVSSEAISCCGRSKRTCTETGMADPAVLEVWRKIRRRGIRRFAFRIRRQQELGLCRGLDAEFAASALHGMLEFTCFNWHSGRLDYPEGPLGDDVAVDTLYGLVARVLELDDPLSPPPPPRAPPG